MMAHKAISLKPLKIALIAPTAEDCPPLLYGGIERVVSELAARLNNLGHTVILYATGTSRVPDGVTLVPVYPQSLRSIPDCADAGLRDLLTADGARRAISHADSIGVDIIHNHVTSGVLYSDTRCPMVTTAHNHMGNPVENYVHLMFPEHPVISISDSQRDACPDLNWIGTVHNGIPVSTFEPVYDLTGDVVLHGSQTRDSDHAGHTLERGKYVAFLGRFSSEKGPERAIEVAKKCGIKLVMAGKVDASDREHFETKVKPHIDGKTVIFLGEVNHQEKEVLLSGARALLAMARATWAEPFGLYLVEAMACGTPVVAIKSGATPEVIAHGKTGFVVRDHLGDIAHALGRIHMIDRRACRAHAEENFSSEKMTDGYEAIYRSLAVPQARRVRLVASR